MKIRITESQLLLLKESIDYKINYRQDDEDTIKISLNNTVKNNFAYCIIESCFDGYWLFEDYLSEEEYYNLFPTDSFMKLNTIEVNDTHKNSGYAKILMNLAIRKTKELGFKYLFLNASPMGFTGLNINDLINFYKSFGFTVIKHYGNNAQMLLNL